MMLKSAPWTTFLHAGIGLLLSSLPLQAESIRVTVENLQSADGFFFTPVWFGFHDGSFDLFDSGSPSSAALETIAETGDAGPLNSLLSSANNANGTARFGSLITAPGGFVGAPVFDPGESVSQVFNVTDAGSNQYLTYASMVIPSNDAFFGNENPRQALVFNSDGSFAGPLTIEIFGGQVYDAGTELNDGMGAAFSALGGSETDEGSVVQMHPGLDNFLGTDTAAGTTLGSALNAESPLARITIQAVPEPSSLALALLGTTALIARRRCLARRSRDVG